MEDGVREHELDTLFDAQDAAAGERPPSLDV